MFMILTVSDAHINQNGNYNFLSVVKDKAIVSEGLGGRSIIYISTFTTTKICLTDLVCRIYNPNIPIVTLYILE